MVKWIAIEKLAINTNHSCRFININHKHWPSWPALFRGKNRATNRCSTTTESLMSCFFSKNPYMIQLRCSHIIIPTYFWWFRNQMLVDLAHTPSTITDPCITYIYHSVLPTFTININNSCKKNNCPMDPSWVISDGQTGILGNLYLSQSPFFRGDVKLRERNTVDGSEIPNNRDVWNLGTDGINYQPQLVSLLDFFHQQYRKQNH